MLIINSILIFFTIITFSTIAPKNLNKNKLKIILNTQCNEYEDLLDKYNDIGVIFF